MTYLRGIIAVFYEQLIATFIGTIAGGAIASFVAYRFTRKASSVEATYEVIHHVLSDDMIEKRLVAREGLKSHAEKDVAGSKKKDAELFAIRTAIITILNYYDVVFTGLKDGMLNEKTIKNSIWEWVRDDHIYFEKFIVEYTKVVPTEKRPLFPNLRHYRDLWG